MMRKKRWKRCLAWFFMALLLSSVGDAVLIPVMAETGTGDPDVLEWEGIRNIVVDGAGPVFEDAFTEGDWTYQVTGGKAGIVHYDGTDTAVSVPDTLGGYPVVFLGAYTFTGEYVEIPGLGTGYYQEDTTVVSLDIPASVEEINKEMFSYLKVLETIQVHSGNKAYASKDGVLFSKDMRTIYNYPQGKKDSSYLVPDSATAARAGCFSRNPHIQSLDLNHIKTMDGEIIYYCTSLERVDLGDACEAINRAVIAYCEKLREVLIPKTVRKLSEVYTSCPAVSILTVQEGSPYYCSVDNVVFNQAKSELVLYAPSRAGREYTVPDTVTTICYRAFSFLQYLEEVTLPERTTMVEYKAMGSVTLKKVTVQNPDCRIMRDADTICKNAVIYGHKPSDAYDYAVEFGRTFVDLKTGGSETNQVTYESMLEAVPQHFTGEPTYQTTDVIHEPDPSRKEYTQLKAFTEGLVAGCRTDYEKAEKISKWVHSHITYQFGTIAGNTIDSVYALFYGSNPKGNCMAYTRLTGYMLYLAGIPSLEVLNTDHEWCMAYIGNEWLIIDATNDVVTNDYTDSLYASPSFLSFSENGNIYVVKNNSGVYLAGVNYGQAGAASAAQVTIPDYVSRIEPSAFHGCTSGLSVTCRSGLEREIKKALPCVKKEGDTLVARVSHAYGGWSYVGGTHEMERFCSQCNSRETKQGQAGTPYWYGKKSYTDIVGKKFLLETKCSSGGKISYKSSNEKVAAVSENGSVTLKGAGTAKITLSAKATNQYTASECVVTIKAVELGKPEITKFQASGVGKNKTSVRVTISWKKAKNAEGYCVCYGSAKNGSSYSMKVVEEDGKATKTVSITVPTETNASNKFWVESYREKEGLSNESKPEYYTKASVSLSKKSYTYNGKAKSPSVTVKVGKKKLVKGKDYTVSYTRNKNIGKAKVSIVLKGNYGGTLSKTFTISPPKVTLSSVKKVSSGKIQVKWKKNTSASGYQIQYAQNKSFTKGKKTRSISGGKKTSQKLSGLKRGTTYYVRIRAYKNVSGQKYYSGWSKSKRKKA